MTVLLAYISCPRIHYFNTLAPFISISHDSYVKGIFFHGLKSFSMLGTLIGLILTVLMLWNMINLLKILKRKGYWRPNVFQRRKMK